MDPALVQAAVIAVGLAAVLAILVRDFGRRRGGGGSGGGGDDVATALRRDQNAAAADGDARVLLPLKFRPFAVRAARQVNYNTKLLTLAIPGGRPLGLPVGRHVTVCAELEGVRVLRPYTPTSPPAQEGSFDLLVKVYRDGKMSQHLDSLRAGDELLVRGPTGRFKPEHMGDADTVLLLAAGSGLTPMLQLARCLAGSRRMALVFQNRAEEDVLMRAELEALGDAVERRFCLSRAPAGWAATSAENVEGYLGADLLRELVGDGSAYACVCGPSGFTDFAVGVLESVGVGGESVHVF